MIETFYLAHFGTIDQAYTGCPFRILTLEIGAISQIKEEQGCLNYRQVLAQKQPYSSHTGLRNVYLCYLFEHRLHCLTLHQNPILQFLH